MQEKATDRLKIRDLLEKQAEQEHQRLQEQKQKDFFNLHIAVRDHMMWNDEETKNWFYRKNPKIGNFTPLDYYGKQPYRCKVWIENMIDGGEDL